MSKAKIIYQIKEKFTVILLWGSVVLAILAIMAYAGFNIWLWVKYGNCTIDQIPAWALNFMFWVKK